MILLVHAVRAIKLVAVLALGIAGADGARAAETSYPARPIRLVVGFAPGGALDALGRLIAPKLSDSMGQTWVVDNRGGAGGNLGTEIVAQASPDGYTVLLALDNQLTANPSLYRLSFNVQSDLQPIVMISKFETMVLVNSSVPAQTLKELVALAKQKPGTLNFASSGVGSNLHLTAEMLARRAGISMVHVPYKGSAPAIAGLLAGETQVMIGAIPSAIEHVRGGRLRALATTGARRHKITPDVPTVAESGYPGFESIAWFALLVPAGTPRSIVERIRNESNKALEQADVQATMVRPGMDPPDSATPEQLAARIRAETAEFADIVKKAGIRAE